MTNAKQPAFPGIETTSPGPIVKTYKAVAEHFGLHLQTIKGSWVKMGMPRVAWGQYDLSVIERWATEKGLIDQVGAGSYAEKLKREQYLHEKAKRLERELNVEKLKGRLVPLDKAEREMKAMARSIKIELTALPAKIAPFLEDLKATEIQAKLTEAVDETCRNLHTTK